MERHKIKVEFANGDIITTDINGTVEQVVDYYIGKDFWLDLTNTPTQGKAIWFYDGEHYLQHKGGA